MATTAGGLAQGLALIVSTRKGLFFLRSEPSRERWALSEPLFLGHIVHHAVLDPRDQRTLLVASSTGHLGPTLFHSTDAGATFSEASKPPAFAKATGDQRPRAVSTITGKVIPAPRHRRITSSPGRSGRPRSTTARSMG